MFKIFNKILDTTKYDKALSERDGKYYNKLLNILGFNVFVIFGIFICIISLYFISSLKPPTDFYITDTNKKEIKYLQTYSRPIMSSNAVQNWSSNALINIFTFNFTNYQDVVKNSKVYFTDYGYTLFLASLERSGMLNSVASSSLEVTLTPIVKPVIVSTEKNINTGGIRWNIELSAFISYTGTSSPKNEKVYLVVTIDEVLTSENPNGIAISGLRLILE